MFDYLAVNWLAVLIAAAVNVVIGTVWYLPAVFGRRWAALTGRPLGTSPSPMLYVVAIAGSLVTAYVLELLIRVVLSGVGPVVVLDGIVIGLLAWLGFQASALAVGGAFEGRSWTLFAINAGNGAVSLAIMGAILAAMS